MKNYLLFFILLLFLSCREEIHKKHDIKNDSTVTYTFNKIKLDQSKEDIYESFPVNENNIVLLGDSKTESFPAELINDLNIKNRGIAGNTTEDVLNRLEPIVKGKPKKIFIEIGVNDLSNQKSPEETFKNFKLICIRIKTESPNTIIYATTVSPTTYYKSNLNKAINEYNGLLENYSHESNITLINTHDALLKGKELNKEFTIDGIHLNIKGYKLWYSQLMPYLKS